MLLVQQVSSLHRRVPPCAPYVPQVNIRTPLENRRAQIAAAAHFLAVLVIHCAPTASLDLLLPRKGPPRVHHARVVRMEMLVDNLHAQAVLLDNFLLEQAILHALLAPLAPSPHPGQPVVSVALSVSTRVQADKELVSTVTLVSSLLLWAPLRARVALLGSSRQRPEAEAARRARRASSKMNLDKDSVTDVPMVHSPAVQEALSVEYVLLASSPMLVHPSVRSVLQVDTETLLEDPLVPSAKLVSFLLDLETMNVAFARLANSLHQRARLYARLAPLVNIKILLVSQAAIIATLALFLPLLATPCAPAVQLDSSRLRLRPPRAHHVGLVSTQILLGSPGVRLAGTAPTPLQ